MNTLLDKIDDLSGTVLRDAAIDVYNAAGVSDKNRALAAYLAASGFAKLEDKGSTCAWARRATALDRAARSYAALQQSTCGS